MSSSPPQKPLHNSNDSLPTTPSTSGFKLDFWDTVLLNHNNDNFNPAKNVNDFPQRLNTTTKGVPPVRYKDLISC